MGRKETNAESRRRRDFRGGEKELGEGEIFPVETYLGASKDPRCFTTANNPMHRLMSRKHQLATKVKEFKPFLFIQTRQGTSLRGIFAPLVLSFPSFCLLFFLSDLWPLF